MLVLTRKVNEEIQIGENIRLTIVAIRGRQVRLGISAPATLSIRREELPPLASAPPADLAERRAGTAAGL